MMGEVCNFVKLEKKINMKNKLYEVSNELCEILLNNGFNDVTEKHYPNHFVRLKKDGYNPYGCKRAFSIDNRNYIIFDYIHIKPYYKRTCHGDEMKYKLTSEELKSIISFYKLPTPTRTSIHNNYRNITELHLYYESICSSPEIHQKKAALKFKETYESIKL